MESSISTKQKKVRDSNLELLRIVAMYFVVCHHLIVHGLHEAWYPQTAIVDELQLGVNSVIFMLLNAFFVVAVNCYVLISGYCGIKPTLKKAFSLFSICVFYSLLSYLIYAFAMNDFSVKEFIISFMPFSHTRGLWFVGAYFMLFLMSPLLNAAADYLNGRNVREWIFALMGLVIITFYFGYIWRGNPNSDGFNVFNFLLLYMIGRFLKQNRLLWQLQKYKSLFAYLLCTVVTFVLAFLFAYYTDKPTSVFTVAWRYNSPFVIMGSVALFMFFASLDVKSRIVNSVALSTFAVYLFHENTCMRGFLYDFVRETADGMSLCPLLLYILCLAAGVFVVCTLLDRVRMFIFSVLKSK